METYSETPLHLQPMLAIYNRLQAAEKAARLLESYDRTLRVNAIACCGISGMLFGVTLSNILRLPLVVVRKGGDNCHSWQNVEGPDPYAYNEAEKLRWLFVDDQIASGATFRHVKQRITTRYLEANHYCAGIMLYEGMMMNGSLNGDFHGRVFNLDGVMAAL